jgi:putative membrane protein
VSLSDQKQEHFNTLSKKTGSDFDRAYISYMIRDHKNDIEEFTEQAQKGDDPDIKSWAANKVETWEQHLSMAESLDVVIK